MNIDIDDFVVAKPENLAIFLKIKSNLGDGVFAAESVTEIEPDGSAKKVNILQEHVLANLGEKPALGVCYGVSTQKSLAVRRNETLNFTYERFVDLEYNDLVTFNKMLLRLVGKVRRYYSKDITIRLLEAAGKKRDSYSAKNGLLTIWVPLFVDAEVDNIRVMNGLCHPMWHSLPPELQQRWVAEHAKAKNVTFFNPEQVSNVLDGIRTNGMKDFNKNASDEEMDIFEAWVRYCTTLKKITRRQAEGSLRSDFWTELIPAEPVPKMEEHMLVTEYGARNAEELFCESAAYYLEYGRDAIGSLADLCAECLAVPFDDAENKDEDDD